MTQVLVINPPNSDLVLDAGDGGVIRADDLTDWANLASLGVLTLASALCEIPGVTPVYIDGVVVPWDDLLRYIEENAGDLLAVCVSMLTASYEAGLRILRHVKALRPQIVTIVGNDHFTAMPAACLRARDCIDFGFVGNEVVGPFRALIADLHRGTVRAPQHYPGLVARTVDGVRCTPQRPEPVPAAPRYDLVDAVFPHTAEYRGNFRSRVGPMLEDLLGVEVHAGTPVELARGCIKFSRNDPCTFCSIQYGGMWRNAVPDAGAGWRLLEHAYSAGHDYLSLTADELPLTFGSLLRDMRDDAPAWWRDLPERERPVLGGYARADGLSNGRHAALLADLGIRYLMVGLDAGAPISLAALRKPLAPVTEGDCLQRAERMFQHNVDAMESARNEGLHLKAGFVVGHLGMTAGLLRENAESVCALVDYGKGAIASCDIEVLSPEPGSIDYRYLTEPALATAASARVGLPIADLDLRERIAQRYVGLDLIDREQAMRDYAAALMPELTLDDLAVVRGQVREHCRNVGVVVGE